MERVYCGFSLLLKADDVLRIFGTRLRISRLASVPQKNRRNRLICDSTASPPGRDCLLSPNQRHKFPDLPQTSLSMLLLTHPWLHLQCNLAHASLAFKKISGRPIRQMDQYSSLNGTFPMAFIVVYSGQQMWGISPISCPKSLKTQQSTFL